jgi:hypothetical protein
MIVSNEEVRILAESDPVISAALPTYAVFTMPQALVRPVRNSRRPGPQDRLAYCMGCMRVLRRTL